MSPGPLQVPVAPAQSQAQPGCGAVGGAFAESSMSRGGPVHTGDMISEIALAIEMGADDVDIGKTIHLHPRWLSQLAWLRKWRMGVVRICRLCENKRGS